MSLVVVGMADCRCSRAAGEVLVTYALGSCIAVAVFDPVAGVGGLLHYMLPESSLDPAGAAANPHKFGDTGIGALLAEAYRRGAAQKRLLVWLAGGAQVMDDGGVFNIGRRNYNAARRILWKSGILLHAEAVGGSVSRTVRLELPTGRFLVREGSGAEREMLPSRPLRKGEPWHIAS